MARVAARVLRVAVGLVVDALAAVDGGAGGGDALLLCRGLLVGVAEGLVHRLVVIGTVDVAGDFSYTTSHRTLGGGHHIKGKCQVILLSHYQSAPLIVCKTVYGTGDSGNRRYQPKMTQRKLSRTHI